MHLSIALEWSFFRRPARSAETRLESELPLTFKITALAFAPMGSDVINKLRAGVRDVPDFPKKGIVFKDITPMLSDPALFRAPIDLFLEPSPGKKITKILRINHPRFL